MPDFVSGHGTDRYAPVATGRTYASAVAQYRVIRVEELTQASELEGELAVADHEGYDYLDSFVLGKHATIILRKNDPQR